MAGPELYPSGFRNLPSWSSSNAWRSREELSQLEGRAYKSPGNTGYAADTTDDRAKVEWVIRAPNGGAVTLVARHESAGTIQLPSISSSQRCYQMNPQVRRDDREALGQVISVAPHDQVTGIASKGITIRRLVRSVPINAKSKLPCVVKRSALATGRNLASYMRAGIATAGIGGACDP
jgi:hypothetical protein